MTSRPITAIRLLRDDFVRAIAEEASGERVLEFYRQALRHQGFAPSAGYNAIIDQAAGHLREWQFEDIVVAGMPSDGKSYAWAFKTEPGWDVDCAELSMIRPARQLLCSFAEKPMCLARFSRSAHLDASVVHVGEGTRPEHYSGIDVSGKLVLAWGTPNAVAQEAIWSRGAAGLLWYRTENKDETPEATQVVYTLQWESYEGRPLTFGFSLSYQAATALVQLLESGQDIVLRVDIDARVYGTELRVATGVLRGTEEPEREIWVLGHCDHRNTGGINNLTGHGASLETARALSQLIRTGVLPPPRRTIRFFWGPEHNGVVLYLHAHPELRDRIMGVINLDMVGMHRIKTGARLTMRRTPHSAPHYINDVAQYFLDRIEWGNEIDFRNVNILVAGGDTAGFAAPILAPSGSRDSFNAGVAEFWGPSDQEDLMDGSLAVPTLLLSEWPDRFFHTDLDNEDNADATQLLRVVAMTGATAYYLAQAGSEDLPALTANALTKARTRTGGALLQAQRLVEQADAPGLADAVRGAHDRLGQFWRVEGAALRSLEELCGQAGTDARLGAAGDSLALDEAPAHAALTAVALQRCHELGLPVETLDEPAEALPAWGTWVPERVPEVRGPINLYRPSYGQWWLRERLGNLNFLHLPLLTDGFYHPWETLNLVDGQRTIAEIRSVLSAEYSAVPLEHIYEYLNMLVEAGALRWRPSMQNGAR
jgi:aminopeptidase YwaD